MVRYLYFVILSLATRYSLLIVYWLKSCYNFDYQFVVVVGTN
jgi:hypothetical protein